VDEVSAAIEDWGMASGKAVGVAADSGESAGALGAPGGVVGLMLWSSTGWVTDSPSSTGRGGRSLRVGDGKPSSTKKTMSPNSTPPCFFRSQTL